ncbi:MAG TPA: ATP-binding protein [Gemmatimonadales bacterium]|nr:ATP-binding protein [Gemmatimonadales bacterium]
MSFARRLVLGTVVVLVFTVLVLVWSAERSLRRDLEANLVRALEREARLVRAALPADPGAWPEAVRRLATGSGHRIVVVDRASRVRADSDLPADSQALLGLSLADAPEIRDALRGERGSAPVRGRLGPGELHVAIPGVSGAVRVTASLGQVDETVGHARGAVAGGAVIALLAGVVLALVAGRSVTRPIAELAGAARAMATGGRPRFPRSGIPDVDALVQALRQMHRQLSDRFEELRRERAESTALVDAMTEGVIAADGRGRIATANAAARRLLGYGDSEALPDLPELFRAKAAREVVNAVLGGAPVENREVELDGSVLLMNARPLPSGGALLVLFDLTEVRRLEAVRRDFVANVSHELKTPLTSISGYAETLLTDHPDPDTTHRFLETILGNARRMQKLVDGLLDLSRIEAGRWQPAVEPVDVAAAAQEAWSAFTDRATGRRVELALDLGAGAERVCADPDALRQILTNLFDNALRYSPAGGRITCRSRLDADGIAVSVSDTGPGIPSEHLPRIFERFYRADSSRSREEGGTGLGLAIVKHLVEAHGGRVAAESERGRGTIVTAWFPGSQTG